MSDIVPLILQQEKEKIRNEISGKCLSVIFDGTSRLGEVYLSLLFVLWTLVAEWLACSPRINKSQVAS